MGWQECRLIGSTKVDPKLLQQFAGDVDELESYFKNNLDRNLAKVICEKEDLISTTLATDGNIEYRVDVYCLTFDQLSDLVRTELTESALSGLRARDLEEAMRPQQQQQEES